MTRMGESPALAFPSVAGGGGAVFVATLVGAGKAIGATIASISPAGWVSIGAVAVVGVGIALYNHTKASAKAKEQAKAVAKEEGNRSFGSITIQIQKGTKSIQKGSTRLALNEKGVTKQEAQDALHEQVNMLSNTSGYGKMAKSKTFQEAVMKMSKNIQTKTTTGTCDQPQMRVPFIYNGQQYRIDIRNNGNKPNLLY